MTKLKLSEEVLNIIYPIGSVYMSKNSIDPSTLFGGTWQRIKGRVIVGVDEDDNDFKEPLKIGGSKYLQNHIHYYIRHHFWYGETKDHPNIIGIRDQANGDGIEVPTTDVKDVQTGNSGNLQPYITLYIWMRIS